MTEEVQQVVTPETVTPAPAETVTAEPVNQEPEKTFTQADLDKLVSREKGKLERRHRREQNALLDRIQGGQRQAHAEEGEPKRRDGESYEDFLERRTDWKAERKATEIINRKEAERAQEAKAKTWNQRVREAAKDDPELEEILETSDVPLSRAAQEAVMESDIGPKIVAYLHRNPDEADRIFELSPTSQARELGKLEAKLLAPAEKKPSAAPPPITPITGKAGAEKDPSQMSDKEYEKYRRDRLARRH